MPNDPLEFNAYIDDKHVKVTDADTVGGNLSEKIVEGSGINITIANPGGDEQIIISAEGGTSSSNDEEIIINFDYTSVSPLLVSTISPAGTITKTKLVVDEVFDGVFTVSIGLIGNEDILMASSDNDTTRKFGYTTNPDQLLSDGDTVYLFVTSESGNTQGAGRIILNITR